MSNSKKKQSILIVDDNPINIELLSETLTGFGYEIRMALDGKEAIDSAFYKAPDMILLDINMPEMDGYETCSILKKDSRTNDIPIIFISALNEQFNKIRAFNYGAVDYITKPIQMEEVKARVEVHLKLRNAQEELQSQNEELKKAAKLREDVERITQHDLKNPLSGIFTATQLLELDRDFNENQAEIINIIKRSSRRMLEMINSSLDLFKMEQKLYKLNPIDVDIVEITRQIEEELISYINSKNAFIDVSLNGSPLNNDQKFMVKGETLLIYSMLVNIIKNAIEASPEKGKISIVLSNHDDSSDIAVHNMGVVPEEIRTKFFDKYVTKGKSHGTGLGTYSAKLITSTLNGKISMTSSQTKGTTILIKLPLIQDV